MLPNYQYPVYIELCYLFSYSVRISSKKTTIDIANFAYDLAFYI